MERAREVDKENEDRIAKAKHKQSHCPRCESDRVVTKILECDTEVYVCKSCKNEWVIRAPYYEHYSVHDVSKYVNDIAVAAIDYQKKKYEQEGKEYRNWLVENGIYKETVIDIYDAHMDAYPSTDPKHVSILKSINEK